MANISLDNYSEDFILSISETRIKGFISTNGVVNFLGIPFGEFPARFRTAKILDPSTISGDIDATKYGPRCPQKHDGIHIMMQNMFEKLSTEQRCDETTCLHLNIYSPPEAVRQNQKLPIFAWIHGGGFNNGDNTTEFDGNHLVKRSMELGQPIIIVTLNYRLNVFGFMSSRELIEEAKQLGEVPVLNQGLNDQRIGLQWIQSWIHHFGGDASNVTVGGESAGAASVYSHLMGGLPLFSQAMIQSGASIKLRTLEQAQAGFDTLVKAAGIPATASGAEKLSALRKLTAEKLVGVFDGSVSPPIEDPNWFKDYDHDHPDQAMTGNIPTWCRRTIMGHTTDEAALFLTPLATSSKKEVIEFIDRIGADVPVDMLAWDNKMSPMQTLAIWATEESFINPMMEIASKAVRLGHHIYVYQVTTVDPFPGPLQGFAWHSFGVPLTFYQPPGRIHSSISITQDKMSEAYVRFFWGHEPWEEFAVARRKMSWNAESTGLIETLPVEIVARLDSQPLVKSSPNPEGRSGMNVIAAALQMQTT